MKKTKLSRSLGAAFIISFAAALSGAALAQQIAFETVEQVLEDLRSDPEIEFRAEAGWLIAEGNFTIWTFTDTSHPAHPAVIERRVFEEEGSIKIGTRTICTADRLVCDQLYQEFADERTSERATGNERGPGAIEVIDQPGYSVLLGESHPWTVARREAGILVLRKDGIGAGNSIVGAIQLHRLPEIGSDQEFLSHIISEREQTLGNDPTVSSPVLVERLVERGGNVCVEFEYRYDLTEARRQDGSTAQMRFANNGLRCRHPNDLTIGVRIGYSTRYTGELDVDSFNRSAQEFADSITLKPF